MDLAVLHLTHLLERRETKERERSEKKIIKIDKKETPVRDSSRKPREPTPRESTFERDSSASKGDSVTRHRERLPTPAERTYPIEIDMDMPREPKDRSRGERATRILGRAASPSPRPAWPTCSPAADRRDR